MEASYSKASAHAIESLADYFNSLQVGVGVAGGCEAAVHATRRFLSTMPADSIIVKLDFSNAFNSLHRDYMLERVSEAIPELYKFSHLAYKEHSILQFGEFCLTSQEGSQQGDPLGGLLFCLDIHPILRSTTSPLDIGFMDDITLGGTRKEVSDDVQLFQEEEIKIGLHLKETKCEVIARDHPQPTGSLEGFSVVNSENASLLGARWVLAMLLTTL